MLTIHSGPDCTNFPLPVNKILCHIIDHPLTQTAPALIYNLSSYTRLGLCFTVCSQTDDSMSLDDTVCADCVEPEKAQIYLIV